LRTCPQRRVTKNRHLFRTLIVGPARTGAGIKPGPPAWQAAAQAALPTLRLKNVAASFSGEHGNTNRVPLVFDKLKQGHLEEGEVTDTFISIKRKNIGILTFFSVPCPPFLIAVPDLNERPNASYFVDSSMYNGITPPSNLNQSMGLRNRKG
jgi:hypothetical protein